jgi:hypothetical protein
MAGRILRGGGPRNSPQQQHSPPTAPARVWAAPTWRTGDKVLWNGYTGTFLRETVDNHAEVLIGTRTYRLPKVELRST